MFQSVFVAGHGGLVGSAILRELEKAGYPNLITRSRQELDLRQREEVYSFLQDVRPEAVIVAAAKVGGIQANNEFPVDFLLHNLEIQNNLIAGAHEAGVRKLLFLGSSCIYPKMAPQPIHEQALLSGYLEPTNEAYAIAKIAGIKLCQAYQKQHDDRFISAMPTNLYGPGDNFDLQTSHVLPALLRKVHEAKQRGDRHVTVWGSGTPRREFLHSSDLAAACLFLLENYNEADLINVGYGEDIAICDLAQLICEVVGFEGEIVFDTKKPDGTPRKLLDSSHIRSLGWSPRIPLHDGIKMTYDYYLGQFRNAI